MKTVLLVLGVLSAISAPLLASGAPNASQESSDALQRHFTTAHVAEFMDAIPATIVSPPDVKFHLIAHSRGVADVRKR